MESPKITIDKYAIRFEYKEGLTNIFFNDLFYNHSNRNWHNELMKAIQHCYEECIRYNVEFAEIEEEE